MLAHKEENELVSPTQIKHEFSSLVIAQALPITKNIVSKDQWNSMPWNLIYNICLILNKNVIGFRNICQKLLLLPRYQQSVQNALERYEQYSRAFKSFSDSYCKNKTLLDVEFANILKESNYTIAYFDAYHVRGIQPLIEVLTKQNSQLTALNITYSEISDADAQALAEALTHPNCNLTSLTINESTIGDSGIEKLTEALKDPNCQLTSLTVNESNLGHLGAQIFVSALTHKNCKLTSLKLSNIDIGALGAQKLANALKSPNCNLASLDLEGNNIGDFGIQQLASSLMCPNLLTSLNLSNSRIGAFLGIQALAEALIDPNCKLTNLNLCNTDIGGNWGIQSLVEALISPNCELISLNLTGIEIGDADVKLLAKTVVYLKHKDHQITIINDFKNYEDYLTQAEKEYSERANEQANRVVSTSPTPT